MLGRYLRGIGERRRAVGAVTEAGPLRTLMTRLGLDALEPGAGRSSPVALALA